MNVLDNNRSIFRCISIILIFAFLFNQVIFADDLVTDTLIKETKELFVAERGLSPEEYKENHKLNQSFVDNKNAIENFTPVSSDTTIVQATSSAEYAYYGDTSRLKSISLISGDDYGNIYYEYSNEDINARGYGNLVKSKNVDGSYVIYGYGENSVFTLGEEYNASGAIARRVIPNKLDEAWIYYESGRLKAKAEVSLDGTGLIKVDAWYDNDTHRKMAECTNKPDLNHVIGREYYDMDDPNASIKGIEYDHGTWTHKLAREDSDGKWHKSFYGKLVIGGTATTRLTDEEVYATYNDASTSVMRESITRYTYINADGPDINTIEYVDEISGVNSAFRKYRASRAGTGINDQLLSYEAKYETTDGKWHKYFYDSLKLGTATNGRLTDEEVYETYDNAITSGWRRESITRYIYSNTTNLDVRVKEYEDDINSSNSAYFNYYASPNGTDINDQMLMSLVKYDATDGKWHKYFYDKVLIGEVARGRITDEEVYNIYSDAVTSWRREGITSFAYMNKINFDIKRKDYVNDINSSLSRYYIYDYIARLIYEYDNSANFLSTADISGVIEGYDSYGRLIRVENEKREVTTYDYAVAEDGTIKVITVTLYDSEKNLVSVEKTDAKGNIIYTEEAKKGLIKENIYIYANDGMENEYLAKLTEKVTQKVPGEISITHAVTKEFNSSGGVTALYDGSGNGTRYAYYDGIELGGKSGDLKEILDAKGNVTKYEYQYEEVSRYLMKRRISYYENKSGALNLSYVLETEYDPSGRTIGDLDKYGVKREYEYGLTGEAVTSVREVTSFSDGDANNILVETVKTYSEDGKRLLREERLGAAAREYEYNELGDLARIQDGYSTTTFMYDESGVLKEKEEVTRRDTEGAADDIYKVTIYIGERGSEKVKEVLTYEPGMARSGEIKEREEYHYTNSAVLARVVRKELKNGEYKETLTTLYGVYNGKINRKREIRLQGAEDFIYDDDGLLVKSVYTDGIYFAKSEKFYNISGDVARTVIASPSASEGEAIYIDSSAPLGPQNDGTGGNDGDGHSRESGNLSPAEEKITDITYIKNSNGDVTGKTETVKYKEYDQSGAEITNEVLSKTVYTYNDKGVLKSLTEGAKTTVYENTYNEKGLLDVAKETATWQEGSNIYNAFSYKKFNNNGDIVASIDTDGLYSEYYYAEKPLGGKIQTQILFYELIDASSPDKGYKSYKAPGASFPDYKTSEVGGAINLANPSDVGLVMSKTIREYDFENDLIKVTKENGAGVGDDEITTYIYEKDAYGNVAKRYETSSKRGGVKVSEYDKKGDFVSETDRNGVMNIYKYSRDEEGNVILVETRNSLYGGYIRREMRDVAGNVIREIDERGVTTEYSYVKNNNGEVIERLEKITGEIDGVNMDYTQVYKYDEDGDLAEEIDKNGEKRTYDYVYDAFGNISEASSIVYSNGGTGLEKIIKVYNNDGTENKVHYINNPLDAGDDIVKLYEYEYDETTGVLIRVIESGLETSARTVYGYNALGDIEYISAPSGAITSYVYERDDKGFMKRRYASMSLYPESIEVEEYNGFGDKTVYTDANGYRYDYKNVYDTRGNLIEEEESHSRYGEDDKLLWSYVETKFYDKMGHMIKSIDRNGKALAYRYDFNDEGKVMASYEQDSRYEGEVINKFNPATGDLVEVVDRLGHATKYEYERSKEHGGVTLRREFGVLGEVTEYRMDEYGRIVGVKDRLGRDVTVSLEFDGYGNMLKRVLSWQENLSGVSRDFIESEYYDVDGNLARRIDYTLKEYRYQYERDESGNLKKMMEITINYNGNLPTVNVTSVEYDREGRRVASTDKTGKTIYYSYDIARSGDVRKVYEGLSRDNRYDALVEIKPARTYTYEASNSLSGQEYRLYDMGFDGYSDVNLVWAGGGVPGSIVMDLTGDAGGNIEDIGALGIALRENGRWYNYKVYYATALEPENWIELVDRTNVELEKKGDFIVEKFNEPVTARYIRLQGWRNAYDDSELSLEELKVYRQEEKSSSIGLSEIDEYGRVTNDKNSLTMVWEDRSEVRELFPLINETSGRGGYWNGRKVEDWAKFIGGWEDERVEEYITSYDNERYPEIESTFIRGDKSDKILAASARNTVKNEGIGYLTDSYLAEMAHMEFSETDKGYFKIEMDSPEVIDTVRILLYDSPRMAYKYKVYTSLDGENWGEAVVDKTGGEYVTGWQEDRFSPREVKYIKIEGDSMYWSDEARKSYELGISEVLVLDSRSNIKGTGRYTKEEMEEWAKKVGFRYDSDLIKFMDTGSGKPGADVKGYSYKMDSIGGVSMKLTRSLFGPDKIEFYNAKGALVEEYTFEVSDSGATPGPRRAAQYVEYDGGGNITLERNILALVWEERSDIRDYFITPAAGGTGKYDGWTLKKWAKEVGGLEDARLAAYRDGNLDELDDAYLAAYSYLKDDNGNIRAMSRTVNLKEKTVTYYDAPTTAGVEGATNSGNIPAVGEVVKEYTKALTAARDIHTYTYHDNGNLAIKTTKRTGSENKETSILYNTSGDAAIFRDGGTDYNYVYNYDNWNNIEKIRVKSDETLFVTKEKIRALDEAKARITEYYNGMLYRDPREEELAKYVSYWRETGFVDLARSEILWGDEYATSLRASDGTEPSLRGPEGAEAIYSPDPYSAKAKSLRDERVAGTKSLLAAAKTTIENTITRAREVITAITGAMALAKETYAARKDKNDQKYIAGIIREELGREGSETEIIDNLNYMRENKLTLNETRSRIRDENNPDSEYNTRRRAIESIINSLYNTETGTGLLTDYLATTAEVGYVVNDANTSAVSDSSVIPSEGEARVEGSKTAWLASHGYSIKSDLLVDLTQNDIAKIITWLKSQDNHFGKSAVEALYASLTTAGVWEATNADTTPEVRMDALLAELIFIDIITGVITAETQGELLISMHAIKKVAQKYGLDLYGTKYTLDELLSSLRGAEGDEAISIIVHYNATHFLNVVGVVRDASGAITHIKVINGYTPTAEVGYVVNDANTSAVSEGTARAKLIPLAEFKTYYEGKILSMERSDYNKRLTDAQLLTITGAGWWSKLWKGVEKFFSGVVKATKKIINSIIEPFKQIINAIKYAAENGKWGRVAGAVGTLVIGSVVAFFAGVSGAGYLIPTIINTTLNMATSIAYGQYESALIQLGLGVAMMTAQNILVFGFKNFISNKLPDPSTGVENSIFTTANKTTGEVVKQSVGQQLATNPSFLDGGMVTLFKGFTGGLILSSLQGHIMDEVNDTNNWLSKLGIAVLGTTLLLPVTAFANPSFGVLENGANWLNAPNSHINIMNEVIFDSFSQLASNETYKALEDSLGEEWYGDLLRSSVNSVISAGLAAVKDATHAQIYTGIQQKYNKDGGKTVQIKTNEDGETEFTVWSNSKEEPEAIVLIGKDEVLEIDLKNEQVFRRTKYEEKLDLVVTRDSNGNYIIRGENIVKDPSAILGESYWTSTSLKEKLEIAKNFYNGYGVVTDNELFISVQNEYNSIINNAQNGDRIFFSGETIIDRGIKTVEFYKGNGGVIMTHEGVVTEINGIKYVYEIIPKGALEVFGGNALKLVPIEQALGRYVKVDSQGNVIDVHGYFKAVRPDDIKASQDAVDHIKNTYFNIDEINNAAPSKVIYAKNPVSVNLKALLGNYNNNDPNSMICSELYNRSYYSVNGSLPSGITRDYTLPNDQSWWQRISPQDDFNARDEYGEELSVIANGQQ